MKIRVVKFDPKSNEWTEHQITGGKLGEYYRLIGCTTIDIVALNHNLDVYIDDEGLLVDNPIMSMVMGNGIVRQLAGVLVFTGGADKDGNTVGCTYDIEALKHAVLSF